MKNRATIDAANRIAILKAALPSDLRAELERAIAARFERRAGARLLSEAEVSKEIEALLERRGRADRAPERHGADRDRGAGQRARRGLPQADRSADLPVARGARSRRPARAVRLGRRAEPADPERRLAEDEGGLRRAHAGAARDLEACPGFDYTELPTARKLAAERQSNSAAEYLRSVEAHAARNATGETPAKPSPKSTSVSKE